MEKKRISIILKLIFWIIVLLIFFATGSYFFPARIAIVGAVTSATIFLSTLLINEYLLFPRFYTSNRKKYFLIIILVSVLLALLHVLIDRYSIPKEFERHFKKLPLIFPFVRSFSLVVLGNFISITFLLTDALKSNAEREKKLKEEKLGTEIKLLKAQINPHFIFNALNNIYSLTYTKSEAAPESVLKLSEMLRYVFYDCSNDHVKLGAEIEYISNFIGFQQMKSEHDQNIQFRYQEAKEDLNIAPMLFIPFIENSFKYSKVEEYIDAYVKINIISNDNYLDFNIINSIPYQGKAVSGNGLGIQNVRQRLDILYLFILYLKLY